MTRSSAVLALVPLWLTVACGSGEPDPNAPKVCAFPTCSLSSGPEKCFGDQLCDDCSCIDAFDRDYSVSWGFLVLPEKTREGADWDPDGSAPEVIVQLQHRSQVVAEPGVLTAPGRIPWSALGTVHIQRGDPVTFVVLDDDGAEGRQHMFQCTFAADSADRLEISQVGLACLTDSTTPASAASSFRFKLTPR